MGEDDADVYEGDWAELGGWPEPALPPEEDDAGAWPDTGEGEGDEADAGY